MVRIDSFAVEQWMNEYENTPGVFNIAETCSSSISIDELTQLSTDDAFNKPFDSSKPMIYGAIQGSRTLREHVAKLCSSVDGPQLPTENVLIAQGAISANFMALYALIGAGDHVICVYPTYQQLYAVPASLGAEVSLWRLQEENRNVPAMNDLKSLVKDNTKMIIINNPNNPTGAPIPQKTLQDIAAYAKERGIILFSDEVYRPLYHSVPEGTQPPPPATALGYEKTLVTGSMSKAYALAGIRVGWIASWDKSIIETIAHTRDYTTISVSQVDDQIASFALSPAVQPSLLARNTKLAQHNFQILKAFIKKYEAVCSWVEPQAGTTAFICFKKQGKPVVDTEFCLELLKEMQVFVVPGSHCFGGDQDFAGYVRIGYVCQTSVLEEGLKRLGEYIERRLL